MTGTSGRPTARQGQAERSGGTAQQRSRTAGASRRGMLAASAAAGLALFGGTGCGTSSTSSARSGSEPGAGSGGRSSGATSPSPRRTRRRPQLPRGGRELFPRYRMVGYCGLPGAAALGRLGSGDPDGRIRELEKKARDFDDGREVLPVLELLATVANPTPGPDGKYRTRTPEKTLRRFHELAGEHEALLLLNVQPGRAAALDEVKALHDWLVHPDVGVALDPEWDMGSGQIPGETYGRTSGKELNDVADYLAGLVEEHDLPHKPLVFHQVSTSVVSDEKVLRPVDGVPVIKCADGIGSPDLKRATWRQLVDGMPEDLHTGFKLFYEEDTEGSRLMKPEEVLALRPAPEYVVYE
ncbi:hypothetical protein ACFPA8_14645 [Streptomyces ovatisporus]|uniref:Lipoprotein n=1 Tax=Streptomyces ovatisporus TaxID=1128682 RepID=A0ABV9A7X5_9ACTN